MLILFLQINAIAFFAVFYLNCQAQTLTAETQGRIDFNSFTPKTMFDLAKENRGAWSAQPIWGDLSLPMSHVTKVPAIVLMHGSGGIESSMAQWVQALNEIGVATFVVHVFEARGVKRTIENQALVPPAADLMDAFHALMLLAQHPKIDASKIGIMGFSRGGNVAFQSALEPLRAAVIKTNLKFALHIPVYAGCNQIYWSLNITRAPILNLIGESDNYTTAAPCAQLTQRYAEAGAQTMSIQYANAHHAWDANYAVFYLANARSGAACGIVRWDIEQWKITVERTGEILEPENLSRFFTSCTKRGVTVGRNNAAYQQSRKDVQNFVQKIFLPNLLNSQ